MDFIWYLNDQPVGKFRPVGVDDGMGVITGAFHPLPIFETVRSVFEPLADNEGVWEASEIVVQTMSGLSVPVTIVHIWDEPDDLAVQQPFEADMMIGDRVVFDDDRFGLRLLLPSWADLPNF